MDWNGHDKLVFVRFPYSGGMDYNGWFQESWPRDTGELAARIRHAIKPTTDDRIAVVSSTASNSFIPAGLLGRALQRHDYAYTEDAIPELREKYFGGNAWSAFKILMQLPQGIVIALADIGMVKALAKIAVRGERTRIPKWDGGHCSGYVLLRNYMDERPVVRTISLEDLV